jgi:hypothetical protein
LIIASSHLPANDPEFAKLYAHTSTFAELTGRNIAVGVDL